MNFDLRLVCLKEQRKIGGLSGSEFWSAKPIWVLGFLLQLKANLCVWRNREESVGWAGMNFYRERRFGFLGFCFFFFFLGSFVPWINGCLLSYGIVFLFFFFFFNDKCVFVWKGASLIAPYDFLNVNFTRVSFLDKLFA